MVVSIRAYRLVYFKNYQFSVQDSKRTLLYEIELLSQNIINAIPIKGYKSKVTNSLTLKNFRTFIYFLLIVIVVAVKLI